MQRTTALRFTLAVALALPGVALAEHDYFQDWQRPHVHDARCTHPPAGAPSRAGRYELRTVKTWVPGYYTQQWVPCDHRGHHRGHRGHRPRRCEGGHYVKQWVPGQYVTTQQQVWVPYRRPNRRGYEPSHSASAANAQVGVSVHARQARSRVDVRFSGTM